MATDVQLNLHDSRHVSPDHPQHVTGVNSDAAPHQENHTAATIPPTDLDSHKINVEQELNGDSSTPVSTTYGTRSRHRPGRARPNYADDKDIDLEIEAASKYQKPSRKSLNTAAPSTATHVTDSPAKTNGVQVDAEDSPMYERDDSSDNGTASGGRAPTASSSKKRKQPGSGTTLFTPHTAPSKPRTIGHTRAQFIGTNMLSFERSKARLNGQEQLIADDGTTIMVNDYLYFVCEPPGEPYYLGRIMEFLHTDNNPAGVVDAVRVNWFYRPKDIQRRVQDTRVVFASMHSDTCPLTSMRGKCDIQHLNNIPNLEEFRKQPDSFWFDKLYDRYMHRYYEVVPTSKIVNVPANVKKVLDERWKYVLIEVGRGRELTSASKVCKRCTDFAANTNSVDCAVCKNTYHMQCVRPPLLRKPARGFAWACAACSRAQELRLEARNTPLSENDHGKFADAESFEDEEEVLTPAQDQTTRESSVGVHDHPPPTEAQLAQANLWQWRYLGVHARPEDALDYDDRIYPRASSRLGPRHQANVNVWHGRPIEYIKPADAKKKYKPNASSKKDGKATVAADHDKRDKRPRWVYDEPTGFVHRGEDEPIETGKGKRDYTAQLTFKMPDVAGFTTRGSDEDGRPRDYESLVDQYMERIQSEIPQLYGRKRGQTDIMTKALEKLQEHNYDPDKALEAMRHLSARTDLKLPELSKEEIKRFEEGVSKYGSELHLVARHVSPTIKEGRIVRFYYMWKKTPRGKEVWGTYEGRKSKKDTKRYDKDGNVIKLLDDVADEVDDSAFDDKKAVKLKRGFICKFCSAHTSRFWRRAPFTAPGTLVPRDSGLKNAKDRSNWLSVALCGHCAYLWRRYAVQYESIEDIGKKITVAGGRQSKRKIDEETLRIVIDAHIFAGDVLSRAAAQIAISAGIHVPEYLIESDEPPKKKLKPENGVAAADVVVEKSKSVPEKPKELEPLKPDMPKVKEHPCAVCHILDDTQHKILKCRDCRLHVHASCYGVDTQASTGPWFCDMCKNDHNNLVSTNYECVLCPVRRTPQELMEPPKVSHKKKNDREREKERAEREMVQEAGRRWREEQLHAGRPVDPREPLKRTAWNNWIHVHCAIWTKEIKFGEPDDLDCAEGVGYIPFERYKLPCKFCKSTEFPTVPCHFPNCSQNFHVGCAHQNGARLGFDILPVKMSRRDTVPVMKLEQESGLAVAAIWCPHHPVSTIVHGMLESTSTGLTTLQEYARTYKAVDSSTTGTVRRAAQFLYNAPVRAGALLQTPDGRSSLLNGKTSLPGHAGVNGSTTRSPSPMSPGTGGSRDEMSSFNAAGPAVKAEKKCCTCLVEVSPRWWKAGSRLVGRVAAPDIVHSSPTRPSISTLTQPGTSQDFQQVKAEQTEARFLTAPAEVIRYQCHKCHVQRRTPPPSPSIARHREVTSAAVEDMPLPPPPPPPVPFDLQPLPPQSSLPHYENAVHSHLLANGSAHTWPPAPGVGPSWPSPAAPSHVSRTDYRFSPSYARIPGADYGYGAFVAPGSTPAGPPLPASTPSAYLNGSGQYPPPPPPPAQPTYIHSGVSQPLGPPPPPVPPPSAPPRELSPLGLPPYRASGSIYAPPPQILNHDLNTAGSSQLQPIMLPDSPRAAPAQSRAEVPGDTIVTAGTTVATTGSAIADRRGSTTVSTGASASPSIKHLLS